MELFTEQLFQSGAASQLLVPLVLVELSLIQTQVCFKCEAALGSTHSLFLKSHLMKFMDLVKFRAAQIKSKARTK